MPTTSTTAWARTMLTAGILVRPWFMGLSLVLALASSGFDVTRHEPSLLLIGSLGWLQTANFVATGLLAIMCAVGLRRALKAGRAGTWGPILMGVYGAMLIIAGVVHPDPHHGFPVGASAGVLRPPTMQAEMQGLAFMLLVLAIVANGLCLRSPVLGDPTSVGNIQHWQFCGHPGARDAWDRADDGGPGWFALVRRCCSDILLGISDRNPSPR